MLKRGLRSEKLLSSDFRTGVRLPTPPAPLDSDFDTKLESSFLFILANSALKAPFKAAYLQLGHEPHPLLQNATRSLCGPNVTFFVYRAVI